LRNGVILAKAVGDTRCAHVVCAGRVGRVGVLSQRTNLVAHAVGRGRRRRECVGWAQYAARRSRAGLVVAWVACDTRGSVGPLLSFQKVSLRIIACPPILYRYSMGTLWILYGYSMDTLWILYGYSIDTPQITRRYSIDTLQILYRYSMDTLWILYGYSMDTL
jgi:hypothetical protein